MPATRLARMVILLRSGQLALYQSDGAGEVLLGVAVALGGGATVRVGVIVA